jgi:hypothetical protein
MVNCIKLLFLVFLLQVGCKIDREKEVDRSKFQFKIGADANLFFRNVRQIYYDRSSPDGTWQAYRFSDRYTGNDRPVIEPVIVINWLQDEAYLLIDVNDLLGEEDMIIVTISDAHANKTDTLYLNQRGRERMLEFGSKLYEAIQANRKVAVQSKGEFVPVFNDEIDREAFRITVSDFYRLTRVF